MQIELEELEELGVALALGGREGGSWLGGGRRGGSSFTPDFNLNLNWDFLGSSSGCKVRRMRRELATDVDCSCLFLLILD